MVTEILATKVFEIEQLNMRLLQLGVERAEAEETLKAVAGFAGWAGRDIIWHQERHRAEYELFWQVSSVYFKLMDIIEKEQERLARWQSMVNPAICRCGELKSAGIWSCYHCNDAAAEASEG